MQLRPLGRSGLQVSTLCLGGNVFGWTADEARSHEILDRYVAAGGNFIDTANAYSGWVPGHSGGESETVIGRWLAARGTRDRVLIATKVGWDMAGLGKGLRREQIERGVEDSLRRLQTDRIDLYYAHIDDPDTPLEESLAAMDRLVKAGKVRTVGASNFSAPRLQAALDVSRRDRLARFECLQPLYNLVERDFERDLAPLCERERLGVCNYSALAAGFLSGKYRRPEDAQGRARGGRVQQFFNPRGWRIVEALHRVAERTGSAPAAVTIAWTLAQPAITSAIASATTAAQLDELVAGTQLDLDRASLDELTQASAA